LGAVILIIGVFFVSWASILIRLCDSAPTTIAFFRMFFSSLMVLVAVPFYKGGWFAKKRRFLGFGLIRDFPGASFLYLDCIAGSNINLIVRRSCNYTTAVCGCFWIHFFKRAHRQGRFRGNNVSNYRKLPCSPRRYGPKLRTFKGRHNGVIRRAYGWHISLYRPLCTPAT